MTQPNRRELLRFIAGGTAGAALIPSAWAIGQLDENEPTAVALGYKADASAVDVTKFPKRASPDGAKQICANCTLYTASDEAYGKCTAIPGKLVAGAGWCSVWVARN